MISCCTLCLAVISGQHNKYRNIEYRNKRKKEKETSICEMTEKWGAEWKKKWLYFFVEVASLIEVITNICIGQNENQFTHTGHQKFTRVFFFHQLKRRCAFISLAKSFAFCRQKFIKFRSMFLFLMASVDAALWNRHHLLLNYVFMCNDQFK